MLDTKFFQIWFCSHNFKKEKETLLGRNDKLSEITPVLGSYVCMSLLVQYHVLKYSEVSHVYLSLLVLCLLFAWIIDTNWFIAWGGSGKHVSSRDQFLMT